MINGIIIRGRQVIVFVARSDIKDYETQFHHSKNYDCYFKGSGYFSTRGNAPVNMNLLFQLCYFLRKGVDLILISWFCYFSEETVSFGIISVKIINKRTLEKRLIKVRSESLKFNVHLGSWLLRHPFINFTLQAQWILASDRPLFIHIQRRGGAQFNLFAVLEWV